MYAIENISNKEKIFILLRCFLIYATIGFIFYRNIIIAVVVGIMSFIMYKERKNDYVNIRRREVLLEFKDFIYNFSVALSTGDMPNKAIVSAYDEMQKNYTEDSFFMNKLSEIIDRQKLGGDLGNLFIEVANETSLEDMKNFANIFKISMDSGANLGEVVKQTMDIINQKHELEAEIKGIFASKKYEMKLVTCIPIGIYIILSLSAKEYIGYLYKDITGYFIITLTIFLIFLADLISKKIMQIKV